MTTINLKRYYPYMTENVMLEVSDEIAAALSMGGRLCDSYKRQKRRNGECSLDTDPGFEADVLRQPMTPDEYIEARETTFALYDALAQLPPTQARRVYQHKKTSAGSQSSTINTNSMKLFLFSEIEIFGATTYSKAGEGSQYSYFATAANRIKYLANGTGSASWWWERSPYGSGSVAFCIVDSGGGAGFNGAYNAGGVCFGFCV